MQAYLTSGKAAHIGRHQVGQVLLLLLVCLLWLPEIPPLWSAWQSDSSLSHGPLIPIIAAGLLWMERDKLRRWDAADKVGLLFSLISACLYIGAVWADIDFLKPFFLICMTLGGIWFLGGASNLRVCFGAVGLLLFMIPWPTTLVSSIAFPLQMMSSAYAALFTGMLGIPIHRDGVNLAVMPTPDGRPVYSIVVAQACSGLTSLIVLLALGYLIAYHTPIRFSWKLLLVGSVVPLTLFNNAIRLTVILIAGAHHNPILAKWIHDHEGPVLILLCSTSLMALRQGLMRIQEGERGRGGEGKEKQGRGKREEGREGKQSDQSKIENRKSKIDDTRHPTPDTLFILIVVLALTLLGSHWGRRVEGASLAQPDFLRRLDLPFRDWATSDIDISPSDREMLEPDATLIRRYRSRDGNSAELAVIAGHRKRSIHTPAFCMAGGGWETLWQSRCDLPIAGRHVDANRAVMSRENRQILVTYFFTDGDYCTHNLVAFQGMQMLKRFRSQTPLGALVRIIVPIQEDETATVKLSDDFARTTLPTVMQSLRQARLQAR